MHYEWYRHPGEHEAWSLETPIGVLYFDRGDWPTCDHPGDWRYIASSWGVFSWLPGSMSVGEVKEIVVRDARRELARVARRLQAIENETKRSKSRTTSYQRSSSSDSVSSGP
jgi:hypothetical protein